MFLKDLNPIQQKLFLGLARELIEADAQISAQEKQLIAALSAEMGQPELIRNPSDEVLQQFFPDKNSRVAVMLELISLASCDGSFSAEEKAIIDRIKALFAMSDDDLKAYTEWVARLFKTYAESAKFFQVS